MVNSFFPSLFSDSAIVSIAIGEILVERSSVNESCIRISGQYRPMNFLVDYLEAQGFDPSWIDNVGYKHNSDGSLSVFDIY